jgi:hypothetical protein
MRRAMESDPSTAEPDADPPPEPQHTVHSEPEEPAGDENEESEGDDSTRRTSRTPGYGRA